MWCVVCLCVYQTITGHQYPVFSVLHVASHSRRRSNDDNDIDSAIDGTYVISADTTDRHISVWSVNICALLVFYCLKFTHAV